MRTNDELRSTIKKHQKIKTTVESDRGQHLDQPLAPINLGRT
ncbi:hypothetical protein EV13_1696 [Prochlorococcus sp. MIT 0702]|nr:hypothetical protein EV13_1696 [Prochlorococcus sp. MIT 0702]KGG33659.1 hypothetical protein EV14_1610 [Prochlorococcus sp. MIT 0703]